MTKFVHKIASILAPATLLSLAACATPFNADVTRFQQLPPAEGQTFTVQAAKAEDTGGLEFASYASMVSDKMESLGYKPAAAANAEGEATAPDLTVTLAYGVDKGKERRIRRDPFYDPWWGYGSFYNRRYLGYRRGYFRRSRFGRRYISGFYDPFLYGGHDFHGDYYDRDFTVYTSDVALDIKRNSDGTSLFEGKAEAKSRSNKLTYLVPNLIEAMFSDFPGNNGETTRISVAPEEKK